MRVATEEVKEVRRAVTVSYKYRFGYSKCRTSYWRSNQEVSFWFAVFYFAVSLYIHRVKNSKRFENLGKM